MGGDFGENLVLAILVLVMVSAMVARLLAHWRRSWRRWRYRRMLRSPEWIRFRAAYWQRHPYRCVICGRTDHVQIHHVRYIFGRRPWDYPESLLRGLCDGCHRQQHGLT
jgi:5-methylcytosine-specific restriction endonuclease McrA